VNVDTGFVSPAHLSLDQGMIMAALGNELGGDVLRRAFATAEMRRSLRPVLGVEEFNVEPRACTISGTAADDRLSGTRGEDVICGLGGDDRIDAREGSDVVYGDEGDDHVSGDLGADTLYGDDGDDRLEGGLGADVLAGGPGNDGLEGGPGQDHLEQGGG
jgi:Ca2+-binding RTX toxin-like protein